MIEELERRLLLTELAVLEQSLADLGQTGALELSIDRDGLSVQDLRGVKNRLERLVRSLGGVKRQ